MSENIVNLLLCFFIYGFLGWLLESSFKSIRDRRLINSGFLYGPLVPIYGFAAILMTLVLSPLAVMLTLLGPFHSLIVQLGLVIVISSLLEYTTGALLERVFRRQWWDYSDSRFHIKGRVSLGYSMTWGLLGYCTLEFIHPWLMRGLGSIPFDLKCILGLLLVVYLPLDIVKCLEALGKLPKVNITGIIRDRSIQVLFKQNKMHSMDRQASIEDFSQCIDDLVYHPLVQEMKQYRHHYSTSCFHHSLNVSYSSYRLCKLLGWDCKAAARGGMLHDLFLYDWRTTDLEEGRHGFVHPQIALKNASGVSELSDLEKDIILKHMFPLTWRPPRYKESILVCLIDKYWAVKELFAFGIASDRYVKNRHIPIPELVG